MKRREVMAGVVAAAGAEWLARSGAAQDRPKKLRVGFVSIANPRNSMPWSAFETRLHELGYIEGQNLEIDYTNLDGRIEGAREAVRAQVARKADVLLTLTEIVLREAIAATTTLPIVMAAIDYDPLKLGYVTSLARPDGNVTGVVLQQLELAEKRLQIMKEAIPNVAKATVFWDGPSAQQWEASRTAAHSLGFELVGAQFTAAPYDYEAGLAGAPADHRHLMIVCNSPVFFRDRVRLAELALRDRAASMFAWREWVEAGGLISYGPGFAEIVRRTADYVDRIARGAKPRDLPIEQPTKFELVVNLKTAKTLGLTIPPSILARADEVIE